MKQPTKTEMKVSQANLPAGIREMAREIATSIVIEKHKTLINYYTNYIIGIMARFNYELNNNETGWIIKHGCEIGDETASEFKRQTETLMAMLNEKKDTSN